MKFASVARKLAGAIHTHCKEDQTIEKPCSEEHFVLLSTAHIFVNSYCPILFTSQGSFLGNTEVLLLLQFWHTFRKAADSDDGVQN